MNLKRKLAAGAATAALMGASFVPLVFADTDLLIEGNGARSNNSINLNSKCISSVYQGNYANVGVNAYLGSNTGDNNANMNTGGDVSTTTGDATTTALVTVQGGGNVATAPDCCDCVAGGEITETIKGNGARSRNSIRSNFFSLTSLKQSNKFNVGVTGLLKSNTGKNDSNKNTGGSVDISTGFADSFFDVFVDVGHNQINP